jgi:hypothetical protein
MKEIATLLALLAMTLTPPHHDILPFDFAQGKLSLRMTKWEFFLVSAPKLFIDKMPLTAPEHLPYY